MPDVEGILALETVPGVADVLWLRCAWFCSESFCVHHSPVPSHSASLRWLLGTNVTGITNESSGSVVPVAHPEASSYTYIACKSHFASGYTEAQRGQITNVLTASQIA